MHAVNTDGGKAKKKLDLAAGQGSDSHTTSKPGSSAGAGSNNKKGYGKPLEECSERTLRRDAEALRATIEDFLARDPGRCLTALKSVINEKGEFAKRTPSMWYIETP